MPWRGNPGRIPTKVPYTSKNPHTRLIFPEERIFRQPRVTSHTSRSGHRKNATLYHKRCPTRLATRRNYRIPTITIMEDDHYHYQDAIQQRLEVHRHPSNHRPRSLPLQHRQHIGPIHVCSAHKATPGPQQQTGPQHLDWISATISTPSPNPSQPDGRGCRKWSHHGPTTPTNKQAPQPQSSHPGHSPGHQPARPTAQCKGWRHQHNMPPRFHTHTHCIPASPDEAIAQNWKLCDLGGISQRWQQPHRPTGTSSRSGNANSSHTTCPKTLRTVPSMVCPWYPSSPRNTGEKRPPNDRRMDFWTGIQQNMGGWTGAPLRRRKIWHRLDHL